MNVQKTLYKKDYRILLNLISELRAQKKIRQIDLAKKLDVPQSFVSKYECGERRLDIIEVREICLCLGVSFTDFIQQLEKKINET